jgi:hypothetical protein
MLAVMLLLGPLSMMATADWDPGDGHKMHHPQLPDLTETGLDVKSMNPNSCADDWKCSKTGPVTDIHFWGSYKGDDGKVNMFWLNIYADNPQGPHDYSEPAELLWSSDDLVPGMWRERIYKEELQEQFWDPKEPQVFTPDTVCWQYNFLFDDPFVQREGEIYWLEVIAWTEYGEWGWKTTLDNFNDDAVWKDDDGQWQELRYPVNHPLEGHSIDLAFVITIPEPATIVMLGIGGAMLAGLWLRRRR